MTTSSTPAGASPNPASALPGTGRAPATPATAPETHKPSAAGDLAAGDRTYIYADNAATTPLSPRALEAMMPYLTDRFGNPSGIHRVAREAARALADARGRMAELLGAQDPAEIVFTSGGTESDNWVLRGSAQLWREKQAQRGDSGTAPRQPLIVSSAIEHHAVLHTCAELERAGAHVVYLPVDEQGRISSQDLERALAHEGGPAALVSVMLANNEIGTVEDVAELARAAHARNAPFHTDAVQAVGHIPVNVTNLGVDALSLSAHKFHGPRGVGALYLRRGFDLPPLIRGGAQERHLRAGTENLAGIAGMVAALEEQIDNLAAAQARVAALRDRLVSVVCNAVPDVHPTGDPVRRLPSIASFACENIDGELAVVILDQLGVAAATGSACSTGSTDPSHVAVAIGAPPASLHGTLRLSLSDAVTDEEVELIARRTIEALRRARSLSAMM